MQEYLNRIDEVIANGRYKDNWESLNQYQTPQSYKDLKFGIFIHWGIYSVPAFAGEWYSRNMYIQGSREFEHHVKTFGPHKDFGYKDFIPMFTAKDFNADEWAELFEKSGAKYVIPVAEHHDGFQMYKSDVSQWNSYNMGPKRDVLGELKGAIEKRNIKVGASTHRVEHWFFMSHGKEFESDIKEPLKRGDFYWPAMPEGNHHDLYSEPTPTEEFLQDWLVRCCELVDNYQPSMVYFDWWIQHASVKPYLKKFAAYYYNRALEWGKDVVINYKHDAFQFGCAVVDIERGQFADAKPYYWQTDTSVARNSWGYTVGNDYKDAKEIVCDLVDIVSKNGNFLLNIGPKSDGTIPDEDKNILLKVGQWLAVNGEGIYGSKLWRQSAEGPTQVKEGQFTDSEAKVFTSEDFRFTAKGDNVYAFNLAWPDDGKISIKAFAIRDASRLPHFSGIVKDVKILGYDGRVQWERNEEALHICAEGIRSDYPVTIKITID